MFEALFAMTLTPADLGQLGLPLLLGGAAVYWLLPRPRPFSPLLGVGLAALAVLSGAFLVLRVSAVTIEVGLFYLFAGSATVAGGLLVTQHDPARAALSLSLVILSVCGLFLLLAAPFLMAATIIIYAGAIIVTFLFVLMLAQQTGLSNADNRSREPLLSTCTGFILLGALLVVIQVSYAKSEAPQVLDDLLTRTRQLRANNPKEVDLVGESFVSIIDTSTAGAELATARSLIAGWKPQAAESADASLARLEQLLLRSRQMHGFLQPSGSEALVPLSAQSGPPANLPIEQLRFGSDGRPQMPHDNSAYLGRSLFTDFLLPVELGGVLLLAATVGAIAIAHRIPPGRRA